MLLAAADPSSYNLFSGVIDCFVLLLTMPSGSCITCCVDSLSFRGLVYTAYMHLVLIVSANHRNNVKRILHNSWTTDTFTNRNRERTMPYIYLNNSLMILLSACPRLYVNRAEPVNRAPDYVYMYEKLKET